MEEGQQFSKPPADQSASPLLSQPTELLLQILQGILVSAQPLHSAGAYLSSSGSRRITPRWVLTFRKQVAAILSTCQHLHLEGTQMFCEQNTVQLDLRRYPDGQCCLLNTEIDIEGASFPSDYLCADMTRPVLDGTDRRIYNWHKNDFDYGKRFAHVNIHISSVNGPNCVYTLCHVLAAFLNGKHVTIEWEAYKKGKYRANNHIAELGDRETQERLAISAFRLLRCKNFRIVSADHIDTQSIVKEVMSPTPAPSLQAQWYDFVSMIHNLPVDHDVSRFLLKETQLVRSIDRALLGSDEAAYLQHTSTLAERVEESIADLIEQLQMSMGQLEQQRRRLRIQAEALNQTD